MRRTLTGILALLLAVSLALALAGCQRKVTITTGEIVICTQGEILEDNTEEIEVPQDEVMNYGVKTKVITCERHSNLANLYDEAQAAIKSGDLDKARELLATVVATDPSYRKAKAQMDAIDADRTPEPDTNDDAADSGDTGTEDPGTEEPSGPVASLTRYVPDSIEGYVAQGIVADPASLSRQYLPTGGNASQLIIEVEQRVSAQVAAEQQAVIIADYPDNSAARTIGGANVVAGARGPYAAAVFTDGPLTVIVELHSNGASGADLIEAAFAVVESITK